MRWTPSARLTSARFADGEVVWSRGLDAGLKLAEDCQRRWQKSPITEEITKETVKTIAQGMPDCFGVPEVT
jgi:hypothetical protein